MKTKEIMNKVFVVGLRGKFKKYEPEVTKKALKILNFLGQKGVLVEIFLVDDNRSKILNQRFRKKDKPANVLSFKEPKGFIYPKKEKRLGEIYLNLGKTTAYGLQTTNIKKRAEDSSLFAVDRLLVHGLLHLLGYDHKKNKGRVKMEKIEQKVIKQLSK